jgi:diphthamide synthase (EF-2-diphthine--ammonia ligase)
LRRACDDAAAFHPCGERGEYHTVVTAYRGARFVDCDPAALPHVERDGIWSLDWRPTYMSDFH